MIEFQRNILNIAAWNINGLVNKISDRYFVNTVNDFDCIVLCETWLSQALDSNSIDGLVPFSKIRPKNAKARRSSGGISILLKPEVRKGVKFIENENDICIWLKFDKTYFRMPQDLLLCACYIPPEGSEFYKKNGKMIDPFIVLEEEILRYKSKGNILVMGDMNARTGTLVDFTKHIDNDRFITQNTELLTSIKDTKVSKRLNKDGTTNAFGKKLIYMCKNAQLRILNGRTIGDLRGNLTYLHPMGTSTIDYAIIAQDMLTQVACFKVHPINYLSDHALISTHINLSAPSVSVAKNTKTKYDKIENGYH